MLRVLPIAVKQCPAIYRHPTAPLGEHSNVGFNRLRDV
ncbi:hypothetical protein R70006_04940 [Paraburkholderia domus]|nr:hypothetical protein R70006_04940 [Paraburkholderia domus]